MDLQEQLEVGKQAEDFLRYTAEHPYFNGLLERMKVQLASLILNLPDEDIAKFSTYRNFMTALDEVRNTITGDIYLGAEALKRLNGETEEPKGLL
jgi:hypothetical protein